MSRQKKLVATFNICVNVPFYSYGSNRKDRKILAQIKRTLKEAIANVGHIDFTNPDGENCCTQQVTSKISSIDWAL